MKIKIPYKDLIKALSIIEQGLDNKSLIEVLKGIKIVAKDNKLEFSTSKANLAITYNIHCDEIINEGSIVVLGTQFINIIKQIRNKDKDILLNKEDNMLVIKAENSTIKLITLPIADFPETLFNNTNELFEINKKIFDVAYSKAKYSVAANHSNNLLTGINLKFTKDNFTVSSSDSKRISFIKLPPVENFINEITIEKHIFSDIIKVLDIIDQNEINVSNDSNQFYIETKDLKLKARVLDGDYVDTSAFLPNSPTYSFEIESGIISSALTMMKQISEKNNASVRLEYIDNELYIKFFVQEFGAIEEKIDVENLEGSPFKIAFNPIFVLDSLSSLGSKTIKFNFEAETTPFTIVNPENDSNIQVISPIRI